MIRHCRDVGTHGTNRVHETRSVLYLEPADRIGIVACPRLRHIVEYARIETSSPTGTAFEQDMREAACDGLHHPVQTEHVTVRSLSLTLSRESRRAYFGHVAVHIPFHISDWGTA
ncbi:hypothetical protein D3C80_1667490 [compost metagenome]